MNERSDLIPILRTGPARPPVRSEPSPMQPVAAPRVEPRQVPQ